MFKFFRKKSRMESVEHNWEDNEDISSKKVHVVSKWGEVRQGKANFYGKEKEFVSVLFNNPLILGYPYMGMKTSEAFFRLDSGCRMARVQGADMDVDDWKLVVKN